jgi:hypothetical protein
MPTQTIGGTTNCTLSFSKAGVNYSMQARVRKITHGFSVIATESAARKYRAFYPHQRAVDPFSLTFELMGYTQAQLVMGYLRNFMQAVVDTGSTSMTVRVPARNFLRQGVPTGGVMDMDQTASNVFLPTIVFDSITDPLDLSTPQVSGISLGSTSADDAAKFFYPSSASTNDPNATADSFYDAAPVVVPPPPAIIPPTKKTNLQVPQ